MKALTKSLLALSMTMTTLAGAQAYAADSSKCTTHGLISVVGQGEVKVNPDRAQLNYRVSAIKDTPEEARVEVEKTITAFSDEVATLKLGDNAFVADNLSIMPRYEYNSDAKKQELRGYEASRNVTINISDFALIGQLNDMAIKSGINEIAGFQYSVHDRRQHEMEAAKKAIEDAKMRAQLLADGFEVTLGQPCSLSFQGNGIAVYRNAVAPRAMLIGAAMDSAGNSVESTYSVEPMVISSSVSATFSIEPQKDKKD